MLFFQNPNRLIKYGSPHKESLAPRHLWYHLDYCRRSGDVVLV
jgi:hypothetical protein